MDEPQWCLDECPTCSTVVHGRSIYCSPECEPQVEPEPEPEHDDVLWSQYNSIRVSAWAFDCYKSSLAPASSPGIFPSPTQRKFHIRKKHPTSWVTSETSSHSSYISPSISAPTAVESLITNSTSPPQLSPVSRWSPQSWSYSSPGPITPPFLMKTNVYLSSDPQAHQPGSTKLIVEKPEPPALPAAEKAQRGRPSHFMPKQRRREHMTTPHPLLPPSA
ncbi:hypothetical protein MSAN_01561400 [Mycena sanguinolenta]|uniref:Uncharacterized protein n=1 Tax=Mycena sanguinolenta TaxID=230812 RepID=A0A8H6Y2N8_9AGAR|nr:hypothetical protein MSAN_01561400 [Mycena sanguinolenta]